MANAFESLLHPVTPAEFRELYYGKQPQLIRGHANKFAGLFDWQDLNRLLNGMTFPNDRVHVAVPGSPSVPKTSTSLIEQCRAGATFGINDVDTLDEKIASFVRALEAETGEPINVNLYVSQPGKAGYPRHYDRHDAFIVQLDGHKGWTIYDRTLERPVFEMVTQSHDAPDEPILECELAPGDVLYCPRGYWHEVVARREMSLHLTVGFNARTGVDFLGWLTRELREDVHFRHELPLSFADETVDVQEERLRQHVATLEQSLVSRLRDHQTIREYRQYCLLNEGHLRRFHLPAQLLETPSSHLGGRHFARPIAHRFELIDAPAGCVTLNVRGHVFHFPREARPLLTFIMQRMEFTDEELAAQAGDLTQQGIRDVLDALLRAGIVETTRHAVSNAAPNERVRSTVVT